MSWFSWSALGLTEEGAPWRGRILELLQKILTTPQCTQICSLAMGVISILLWNNSVIFIAKRLHTIWLQWVEVYTHLKTSTVWAFFVLCISKRVLPALGGPLRVLGVLCWIIGGLVGPGTPLTVLKLSTDELSSKAIEWLFQVLLATKWVLPFLGGPNERILGILRRIIGGLLGPGILFNVK